MDSDKIKEIAVHSGTSISTVRRVLGHCAGITDETRNAVIRSQCTLSHPQTSTHRRVFFVLPDNPKSFWHESLTVLNGHPFDPPVKLSFYSSLQQKNALTTYLQPLLQERDIVLILAATLTNEECALVSAIAEQNLVIQLCERSSIPNTVYVGADAYNEGALLAARLKALAQHIAVIHRADNINVSERIRGFTESIDSSCSVVTVPEPNERSLYASLLARSLHTLTPPPDLLFSPGGYAAETCLAAYKLRDTAPMRCITWEQPPKSDLTDPLLLAVVQQNLAEQTRTALQLATAFLQDGCRPEHTEYIIPSKIKFYD